MGEKKDFVMLFIFSSRSLISSAFVGLGKESIIKVSIDVSSMVSFSFISVELVLLLEISVVCTFMHFLFNPFLTSSDICVIVSLIELDVEVVVAVAVAVEVVSVVVVKVEVEVIFDIVAVVAV